MRRAIAGGVTVGVGTDGSSSADNQNMFEAMRLAAFVSRVFDRPPEDWIGAAEAMRLATEGSAAVLGMGELIGRIAPGYKADLVFLDLDHVNLVPLNNAVQPVGEHRGRRGGARRDGRRPIRAAGRRAARAGLAAHRRAGAGRGGAAGRGERRDARRRRSAWRRWSVISVSDWAVARMICRASCLWVLQRHNDYRTADARRRRTCAPLSNSAVSRIISAATAAIVGSIAERKSSHMRRGRLIAPEPDRNNAMMSSLNGVMNANNAPTRTPGRINGSVT